MRQILVVSENEEVRRQASDILEAQGYEVFCCPGPVQPGYVCIGGRGGQCPLATAADAVIFDPDLTSDLIPGGTPASQLLSYYEGLGKPIVLIAGPGVVDSLFQTEAVAVLPRRFDEASLLSAIHKAVPEPDSAVRRMDDYYEGRYYKADEEARRDAI